MRPSSLQKNPARVVPRAGAGSVTTKRDVDVLRDDVERLAARLMKIVFGNGSMKALFRACRISKVMLRYRLDTLLDGTAAERWLRLAKPFVPRISAGLLSSPEGVGCVWHYRNWGLFL